MIAAAKAGFRAKGVAATGFTDVINDAGAARGAIYHHFPGGKRELTIAVVESSAANVAAAASVMAHATNDRHAALSRVIDAICTAVDQHSGDFGCPVAPTVMEAAGDTEILDAGNAAFRHWQRVLVEDLGLDTDNAALVVASIEGALIMCRAAGSSQPLRSVGNALLAALP
jgi:TetR/AcrR family transcriptional repressor of lmrAB and yxaGH operons